VGLICARLFRSTPPARRLGREPGAIACLAILSATVLQVFWYSRPYLVSPNSGAPLIWWLQAVVHPHRIAFALVEAWFAQSLSGRWRPSRSWIDGIGIALGAVFLIMTFLNVVIDQALRLIPDHRVPWP
jgi:hypothetical protein